MADRTYPSDWMYKDTLGKWRWTYHAKNGEDIAIRSESYANRSDCWRGIEIMKASTSAQVRLPTSLVNES